MPVTRGLIEQAEKKLKFIFYSISPLEKSAPLPYKLWYQSLLAAAQRLPEVKIILSGWPPENPQAVATERAKHTLEAAGAQVKITKVGLIMHPKVMAIDDKILVIGSHNATQAGFCRTKNLSFMVKDDAAAGQFNDYFDFWW